MLVMEYARSSLGRTAASESCHLVVAAQVGFVTRTVVAVNASDLGAEASFVACLVERNLKSGR